MRWQDSSTAIAGCGGRFFRVYEVPHWKDVYLAGREDLFNPVDSFHLMFHRFDQLSHPCRPHCHPCNLNVSETEVHRGTKEVLRMQMDEKDPPGHLVWSLIDRGTVMTSATVFVATLHVSDFRDRGKSMQRARLSGSEPSPTWRCSSLTIRRLDSYTALTIDLRHL